MKNKITDSHWFYQLLALVFALLLFLIANANPKNEVQDTAKMYDADVQRVPIEFNYDNKKYFISGYESQAKVKLKSSNKVLLDTEANEQTRNFKVVANLRSYREGTYEVTLKVENLKSGITANVEPKSVPVTIEKRASQTFNIEPIVDEKMLAEGYRLQEVTLDPTTVEVTTGEQTMKSIHKVVAVVGAKSNVTEGFSEDLDIQALDQKGNSLPIVTEPLKTKINVTVTAPSKAVKLHVSQIGKTPSNIQYFSFSLSQDTIEISGDQAVLDKITQVDIPVDVSRITDTITQSYKLSLPQGIQAETDSVKVTITPTFAKSGGKAETKEKSANSKNRTTNQEQVTDKNNVTPLPETDGTGTVETTGSSKKIKESN